MQENEFDKQVKLKMDEFRLRPSEPVWLKIEEQLRGKRRRGLILIPLFAAMLAAGYFSWQFFFRENKISASAKEVSLKNNIDENKNSDNAGADKITNPSPDLKNETGTDKSVSNNVKATRVVSPNAKKIIKEEENTSSKVSTNKKVSDIATAQNKSIVALVGIKNTGHAAGTDLQIKGNKEVQTNDSYKNKIRRPERNAEENKSVAYPYQNNILDENNLFDNSKMKRDNEPVLVNYGYAGNNLSADSINAATLVSLQLPSLKNLSSINATNTVKLGITFSIGASSRVNKGLQISSADKSTTAPDSYATPSFGNVGGGVSIIPPSDVKPGAAFKIGVLAMKPISKRFDISAGLQYSYSSDQIRVGKSIETSPAYNTGITLNVLAQAYYPNVKNESYTNKYHYIELPVSVYYNLNRKWKVPIVLNSGVSVSRLVSSNVLLYDVTWGGVYYQGNNDINKTQINLSAGFSFQFTGSNHWQWNIGPQVYVSGTKLFQSTYDKNARPVYGGLSVQLLFPGRRK